ncbi:DUF732 domain-containing protein [Mycolicibacter kumamotonensis]|uniref:DUF732 domain-containing protein n=1 Tax=Mycolicibacter kumamotonensis TaxID=354243 RepID=A0A1B8SCN7_9MYCO|nr:DUF732 domain-containing protein [Mycolicibacter kumamotonensis]OBY30508.1 hypothetical protein ACT18_17365 [Mycolicibacter kumamotonensis]
MAAATPAGAPIGVPVASADSQDDYYLQQLKKYGIPTNDTKAKKEAIEAGKATCSLKAQGMRDYDVWQALQSKYPKVDQKTIATTSAVATLVYCPQYLHL